MKIQKFLLGTVAAAAILAGICVAVSAFDNIDAAPLVVSSESKPIQLLPGNLIGEEALDDLVSQANDSLIAGKQPRRKLFQISVHSDDLTERDLIVEIPKTTVLSARIWSSNWSSDSADFNNFGDFIAIPSQMGLSGLIVELPRRSSGDATLILETLQYSAGRPQVFAWTAADYQDALVRQERRRTLYITLFLSLAFFGAGVAALSKDFSFLVFSGWLITSLRVIAINSGWGYSWLEAWISPVFLSQFLTATLALHAFLTISLFGHLHSEGPRFGIFSKALRAFGTGYLAIAILAFLAPKSLVHPALWILAGLGISVLIVQLITRAIRKRSLASFLYLSAWFFMLGGLLGEIGSVSETLGFFPSWLNAETGTLTCGAIMALALSHRLKEEVSSRQRAQSAAAVANKKLAANYEATPIGLFSLGQDGTLRLFNPAFGKIFSRQNSSLPKLGSTSLSELIGADNWTKLLEDAPLGRPIAVKLTSGDTGSADRYLEFQIKTKGRSIEGYVQDVSVRVTAEKSIARLVDHDTLTPSLNQRGHNESVARALDRCAIGEACCVAAIDVDRFKMLNDLHGFEFGDHLLSTLYSKIASHLEPGDSIARIGNVFRLVMFDRESKDAIALVRNIQLDLTSKPIEVDQRLVVISASAGVVSLDASLDVRAAIAACSQACADAKQKGINMAVLFSSQDRALGGYLEELKVQENLQDRIDSQRFFLEFQPIVSFKSAFESLNYEVLVRMRGEDGSVIPPGRFIPAAERNGQMSLIDRWVVQATLRWLDQHRDHIRNLGYATINLSGSSLNDARFVDNLFAMIADYPAVMNKLCFEITETVALADQNATRRFSERVHSMGSQVALDDFGAGYTSFTYLREIDADIIKIDGSFVKDINQNPANYAITRMIVELSHQLGKRCVAEWAEKPDVIATLMQLGVDYGQGFALARPLPPSSLVHVDNCGELIIDPEVRAMLQGTLSTERGASGRTSGIIQPALF